MTPSEINKSMMKRQELIDRFRAARTDRTLAVLEGFHPLKHAIRFGAELLEVVATKDGELELLAADYAPDAAAAIKKHVRVVEPGDFGKLAPVRPPTGVIAIAKRPKTTAAQILDNSQAGPVVLLENPRNLLNIGASIRVAAAAGAAGVVTTGPQDPWHPAAIIAATGLQYAVPVARADALSDCSRLLVVIDSGGEPLRPEILPSQAVYAFGAEREGISEQLMARASQCVSIPMATGVSSLNLATAVSVILYTWKLAQ